MWHTSCQSLTAAGNSQSSHNPILLKAPHWHVNLSHHHPLDMTHCFLHFHSVFIAGILFCMSKPFKWTQVLKGFLSWHLGSTTSDNLVYMEIHLDVWHSHVHSYETSPAIRERVIVLHGNRGMVLCCYYRMTDLRSYPLWFSSTAVRGKEMVSLSWSCRKRKAKETAFLGGTNWKSWITEEVSVYSCRLFPRQRPFLLTNMPLRCRVSGPNKRLQHSKHADVSHNGKIQRAKGPVSWLPKVDGKVTTEGKKQVQNESSWCLQLN